MDYVAGMCYVVTAYAAVTVSIDGSEFLVLKAGSQGSFVYPRHGAVVSITGSHDVTKSSFNGAPASAVGGGGASGVMELVDESSWGVLRAGVLYKRAVTADCDLSAAEFVGAAGECWTAEIALDMTEAVGSVAVVWPTTWLWVDSVDGLPPAELAVGMVHYFAVRSEGGRTYINHSYEL